MRARPCGRQQAVVTHASAGEIVPYLRYSLKGRHLVTGSTLGVKCMPSAFPYLHHRSAPTSALQGKDPLKVPEQQQAEKPDQKLLQAAACPAASPARRALASAREAACRQGRPDQGSCFRRCQTLHVPAHRPSSPCLCVLPFPSLLRSPFLDSACPAPSLFTSFHSPSRLNHQLSPPPRPPPPTLAAPPPSAATVQHHMATHRAGPRQPPAGDAGGGGGINASSRGSGRR